MPGSDRSPREGEARRCSGTRPAARNRTRVLVIDDEAKLLVVISIILQAVHDVRATADAREALEWILGGERFDAILCDMMMAEMTGMDFHLELSRRVPEQADRVIFMSGAIYLPRAQAFLARVPNAFIEKPFTEEALLEVIHKAACTDRS